MPRVLSLLVLLFWLPASGCMLQNTGPTKKLTDAVHEMNKATRWGQLGAASRMVEPAYRSRFAESHRHWGSMVQVADSEVVHMELAGDGETAISLISYQWYLTRAMTLHQSVVRQRWSAMGGGYGLVSEVVVQGDPRLLEPASDAPTTVQPATTLLGNPRDY
ncbi:MAG: hypothetical protein PVI30_04725 [Myxococcales bacterium]|jgi:hypothetical protein